jgi:hypothetical protein
MLALAPALPQHVHGGRVADGGALIVTFAVIAGLVVVAFWLHARRLAPAAWVGRIEAGGPVVWRVSRRLRAPERVRRRVSWGSDGSYAEALAVTVLGRVHRRPPRGLVHAFAGEVLRALPDDGFVLDERAVRTWLMTRPGAPASSAREVIG